MDLLVAVMVLSIVAVLMLTFDMFDCLGCVCVVFGCWIEVGWRYVEIVCLLLVICFCWVNSVGIFFC